MTFSDTGTQADNQDVWHFGNLSFDLPFFLHLKVRLDSVLPTAKRKKMLFNSQLLWRAHITRRQRVRHQRNAACQQREAGRKEAALWEVEFLNLPLNVLRFHLTGLAFYFLSRCSKCSNRITLSLPGLANCLFMQLVLCFMLPWLPGLRQLWSGWCRCPPGPWCRPLVRTAFRTDRPRSSGGTGPWSQPATARGTRYRTLCPARIQDRWNINQSSCERLFWGFF